MKRIVWKANDVVLLELREGLFSVCQMLGPSSYMAFFQLSNTTGDFAGTDLNEVPELFIVSVANNFLRNRGVEKIKKGVVAKRDVEIPTLWLDPKMWPKGDYVWKNADLVEIDPEVGSLGINNPVVQKDITKDDTDILDSYELTNVMTDFPLADRLILCLEQRRNVDPLKEQIFFGDDSNGIIKKRSG